MKQETCRLLAFIQTNTRWFLHLIDSIWGIQVISRGMRRLFCHLPSRVAVVFACLWISATTLSALQRATPVLSLPPASSPTSSPTPASTPTPRMPPAKSAPIATLPVGLPLRVQVDHRYRMRLNAPVAGYLLDPVYISDHVILPAHTPIYGKIVHLAPVHKSTRTWALLNGDVTPLKTPELTFNSIQLPDGTRVPLNSKAIERTAGVVHMAAQKKKPSLWQRIYAPIHAKIQSVKSMLHIHQHHHKSELAFAPPSESTEIFCPFWPSTAAIWLCTRSIVPVGNCT